MKNTTSFTITAALSIVLVYVASEIWLPAMPLLQKWFGSTTHQLRMTLNIYFFGVGVAQLIGGPIIDRFNYRIIAISMCIIFIISSIICALSYGIYTLIAARLFQAMSAGVLAIIGRASLAHRFAPEEAMRIYLSIAPVLALSLSFSPYLGGYLTHFLGWRWVFLITAFFGMVLLILLFRYLNIDRAKSDSISIHPFSVLKTYVTLLGNKTYSAAACITTTAFALHLTYLTETPFIFWKLSYSSQAIGKFYIALSLAFISGSWFTRTFNKRIRYRLLVYLGLAASLSGIFLIFLLSLNGVHYAYEIFLPSVAIGFGNGILIPLGTGKAIYLFPQKAGYATGFLSSINLLIASAIANFAIFFYAWLYSIVYMLYGDNSICGGYKFLFSGKVKRCNWMTGL